MADGKLIVRNFAFDYFFSLAILGSQLHILAPIYKGVEKSALSTSSDTKADEKISPLKSLHPLNGCIQGHVKIIKVHFQALDLNLIKNRWW